MAANALSHPRPTHRLAAQALSRAAGAPLIEGNALRLLIDARDHFDAWLSAIRSARSRILLENYIIRDDEVGRAFRDALTERAQAGASVAVIRDWLGCLGQSDSRFWQPLLAAGGEVRVFNPPRLGRPFGWLSRDHRKLLVVDGQQAFLSGVCLSAKWLGNASKGIAPWRDTGIAIRGPAVAAMERAFVHSWAYTGEALPAIEQIDCPAVGNVALRVIATQPASAGTYRLDQLIAAMARKTLWLSDAYFVGVTPYVQGLAAAARDGVDVRLLVPGSSDIPAIAALSRTGYRPLLRAGVRVFEWNGSMMHAKTAVADDRWARVGSSNLNVASWLGNMELDVAIEDADFARQLADRYEEDLTRATEIILAPARYRPHAQRVQELDSPPKSRSRSGSSSRAAAGALRLANSVGAALSKHRVLSRGEQAPLLIGVAMLSLLALLGAFWPKVLAWPLAVVCAWLAFNLGMRVWRLHKRHSHQDDDG